MAQYLYALTSATLYIIKVSRHFTAPIPQPFMLIFGIFSHSVQHLYNRSICIWIALALQFDQKIITNIISETIYIWKTFRQYETCKEHPKKISNKGKTEKKLKWLLKDMWPTLWHGFQVTETESVRKSVRVHTHLARVHFHQQILGCIQSRMRPWRRLLPMSIEIMSHKGAPSNQTQQISSYITDWFIYYELRTEYTNMKT